MLLCATNKIYILTLVLSEKTFLNETKNHNPPPSPLQVKWSVPKQVGFKALVISKSFSSLLIGCVRRPTPRTDKGSSSITDNMITFNGISVYNILNRIA